MRAYHNYWLMKLQQGKYFYWMAKMAVSTQKNLDDWKDGMNLS